jgi:hypothetical protein
MRLRGLNPNIYIHVSVSDLYLPTIDRHYYLFLGIHKSEPGIYFGFSPAFHLQCIVVAFPDPGFMLEQDSDLGL